ncbi:MAG: MBL fold metallo-hydrolase [Candidatus Freyarchaeota archaeon]|nr:MBL fold metallo-hydrolase [Candidatus Jordarchaeia archaeon]
MGRARRPHGSGGGHWQAGRAKRRGRYVGGGVEWRQPPFGHSSGHYAYYDSERGLVYLGDAGF